MVETFANLGTPPGLHGAAKLAQRRNNPDAFDLYYFSSTSFDPYDVGGTYSAPGLALFARSDFEQFLDVENGCRQRLQEFIRRLLAGELRAGRYE